MDNNILNIAKNLAVKSGQLLLKRTGDIKDIIYKTQRDFITDVDKASEDLIIRGIQQHYPEHSILAEESGLHSLKHDYQWIIDPLDGTLNFAHGFPMFAVSITVHYQNKPFLGVVFDPTHNELFWAQAQQGAWLNDQAIHVSSTKKLIHSFYQQGLSITKIKR